MILSSHQVLSQCDNITAGVGASVGSDSLIITPLSSMVLFGILFMFNGYLLQQEKIGRLEYSTAKRRWVTPSQSHYAPE
jgi:hypothetical protein